MVLLDEPTAALGVAQTAQVLELVERLASRGHAVVVISHNLADVFDVADRIVVLRMGRNAGDFRRRGDHQQEIVAAITGLAPADGGAATSGQEPANDDRRRADVTSTPRTDAGALQPAQRAAWTGCAPASATHGGARRRRRRLPVLVGLVVIWVTSRR